MKIKKPLRYNSKVTEIKCIRCEKEFKSHRNDTKTCSDLCRVQEGIERKEKGYIHRVVFGTKAELDSFLNKLTNWRSVLRFSTLVNKIRNAIEINDNSNAWKMEDTGFRLTFFPGNKKKPFELYFNEAKFKEMELFHSSKSKTPEFKYFG